MMSGGAFIKGLFGPKTSFSVAHSLADFLRLCPLYVGRSHSPCTLGQAHAGPFDHSYSALHVRHVAGLSSHALQNCGGSVPQPATYS